MYETDTDEKPTEVNGEREDLTDRLDTDADKSPHHKGRISYRVHQDREYKLPEGVPDKVTGKDKQIRSPNGIYQEDLDPVPLENAVDEELRDNFNPEVPKEQYGLTTEELTDFIENRHEGYIRNLTRNGNISPDDAEDILQEAYIKAHRNSHKFRHEAKVSTWMHRIIINEYLMHLRKQKRRINDLSIDGQDYIMGSPNVNIVDDLMRDEIMGSLDSVPLHERTPMILRGQGYNNYDAAELLKISVSAFKARLHGGRVKARENLDDREISLVEYI